MAVDKTHFPLIHKFGKDQVNVYLKSFPGDFGVLLVKKNFYKSMFPKLLNDKNGLGHMLKIQAVRTFI